MDDIKSVIALAPVRRQAGSIYALLSGFYFLLFTFEFQNILYE